MRAVLLGVAFLVSCRPDFEIGSSSSGKEPLANAGIGTTVRVTNPITLDGSGSIDPNGIITSYRWQLVGAPANNAAAIDNPDLATTTFTPVLPGDYAFELEVTDDEGFRDQSSVLYRVRLPPLTVDAGADDNVVWRKTVQLAGKILNNEDPQPPALSWAFISKPIRSTATIQNASTLTPRFVGDATGTYVLELTATTPQRTTTDTVSVVVAAQQVTFQGSFIDAVFDLEHDRLVAISDSPPRVRFIATGTGTETTLSVPAAPTALAIDPNEDYLAVATSSQIHIVDLTSKTITASYNVADVAKLVIDPFQLVHGFTAQAGPIFTINVVSGAITQTTFSVPAGTIPQIRSGNIYTADTTVTPADLTHYFSGSPVLYGRDSPYAGEHAIGGNLWLVTFDRLFVRAGNVFQTSPGAADDMLYLTHLAGDEPATLEYARLVGPKIATLHALTGTPYYQFRRYNETSYDLLESLPLPDLLVGGVAQPSTGRLIGFSTTFQNRIVIVASAGSSNAFIVTDQ